LVPKEMTVVKPQWWIGDDELLAELGRPDSARFPVPQAVVDAAVAAFRWRTVDAELAALTYDSLFDDDLLAVARSDPGMRILLFESDELGIELEVDDGVVHGHLRPPQPGQVVLQTVEGHEYSTTANQCGFFRVDMSSHAPFRLRCRTARADCVVTEWTRR